MKGALRLSTELCTAGVFTPALGESDQESVEGAVAGLDDRDEESGDDRTAADEPAESNN